MDRRKKAREPELAVCGSSSQVGKEELKGPRPQERNKPGGSRGPGWERPWLCVPGTLWPHHWGLWGRDGRMAVGRPWFGVVASPPTHFFPPCACNIRPVSSLNLLRVSTTWTSLVPTSLAHVCSFCESQWKPNHGLALF